MYSNYYLQSNSKKDLINFMNKIYHQYIETNLDNKKYGLITLSISNLYNLYDIEEIKVYSKMYNILLIPAFRIILDDFSEVSILNPDYEALNLLTNLKKEMALRNSLIVKEFENINKPISLKRIFRYNSKSIDEINSLDICLELSMAYKEYSNDSLLNIYNKIVKKIYEKYPIPKQNLNDIENVLYENKCILINPENNIKMIEADFIKYVIINENTSEEIHAAIKEFNKDPLFGTGEFI